MWETLIKQDILGEPWSKSIGLAMGQQQLIITAKNKMYPHYLKVNVQLMKYLNILMAENMFSTFKLYLW